MLSWYRGQLKEHGALAATRLLWRVGWSRLTTDFANRALPRKVACPCCGWEGRKFLDYVEVGYTARNIECPRCGSHSRHRALYLWLKDEFRLRDRSGVALVCAPERALAPVWESSPNVRAIRTDIEPARGVDVLADLSRLPFASDSMDIVWCHHVLEQVEDDRAAVRELCRVLRPSTGRLVVSSGTSGEDSTREFGFSDKTLSGNWRSYGKDYAARLAEGGLSVTRIDFKLSARERERYVVNAGEEAYVCSKEAASGGGDA